MPRLFARPIVLLTALAAITLCAFFAWSWLTWPDVSRLAGERPPTTAFMEIYREAQRRRGQPDRVTWRWVAETAISGNLKRAVVTAEDIGFFSHHGFALAEIRQAVSEAVRSGGGLRGASTITQQLAKNLWLSPSRNPLRKVKEAILTAQLERALSKRRILEIYLNVVEFGPGLYGAEAASQHYFSKAAADLTQHEAALLAACLPRPRTWNPRSASEAYARQVARIEARMDRATFLRRWTGETTVGSDSLAGGVADSALSEFLRSDTLLEWPPLPPDGGAITDSTGR